MVTSPEGSHHIIGPMICQTKELCTESLFHFGGGFVGERKGHNIGDGQRVWLSHEKIEDAIHKDCGLSGPGSCNDDDVAVPGGFGQEPVLRISKCERLSHRLPSVFSS